MRKATEKSTPLDLHRNKETFQQAKTFFADPTHSASLVLPAKGIPQQTHRDVSPVQIPQASTSGRCDEEELTGSVQSFLRSCLKLLRNEKAIGELQRIID